MFDTWVITLELGVSFMVGVIILALILRSMKNDEFDDGQKMMNGLLFDSEEDLKDAFAQEQKAKKIRENKKVNNDI
jgi:cbb3-type cytochrome oxidase maturation protein